MSTPNSYVLEALDGKNKRENDFGMHAFDIVCVLLDTFALINDNPMGALQCWRRLCGRVAVHDVNSRVLFP